MRKAVPVEIAQFGWPPGNRPSACRSLHFKQPNTGEVELVRVNALATRSSGAALRTAMTCTAAARQAELRAARQS